MKTRNFALAFSALALAAASFAANAGIVFSNLGTAAPPASVGGHALVPFNQATQTAIPDFTSVSTIPGNPTGADPGLTPSASKRTVPSGGWSATWAHGYMGPVFFVSNNTATLTLPPNTKAFYFYTQGNYYGSNIVTVETDSGATSGPIAVTTNSPGGADGATGFAFYSTAGESITTITINISGGFALGEFGINGESTTCASEGYKNTQLTWCKNICENGLTGQVLDTWIHRWINRYRDLPYCARETPPPPPPPAG